MIEQRYITATAATSLHEDANSITQLDVIKASGMSERNLASHYLRLISKPSRGDMERVFSALLWVAQNRNLAQPQESVSQALRWLVDPRCKVCCGAGVLLKGGKEHVCPKCKGEKLRKEPSDKDVQLLIDYVQICRNAHASRVFKKLH